jgi:MFS family permease
MGVAVLGAESASSAVARAALLVLYAVFFFGIGLIVPVWLDWVAGLFERDVRGRAFGWSGTVAAIGSIAAAACAGWVANRYVCPLNYALQFFIGGAFYLASMAAFVPTRVPAGPGAPREVRGIRALPRVTT